MRWTIGSTTISPGARRCLRSDGPIFARDVVCFDDWTRGAPVSWEAARITTGAVTVTWIGGVSPGPVVRIRLTDGASRTVPAVRTQTDAAARFFGTVVEGTVAVRDVTVLDAAGVPLGEPVTDPGRTCHPGPGPAAFCAETVPDRPGD